MLPGYGFVRSQLRVTVQVAPAVKTLINCSCQWLTCVCAGMCRLARLRWRNAFAVLGTWSRQSTIQSGGQRSSKAPGQLLAKVRQTKQPCEGGMSTLLARSMHSRRARCTCSVTVSHDIIISALVLLGQHAQSALT